MAESNADNNTSSPGRIRKGIAIGTAAAILGGGIGFKILNDRRDSVQLPYQSYQLSEVPGLNNWQENIESQFKPGDTVNLVDLLIHVNDGELEARYTPTVVNPEDGTTGNLAVIFKKGSSFVVKDAPIIEVSLVNPIINKPNDKPSKKFAMISGDNVGLPGQILYIYLGEQTSSQVSSVRPHTATFTMFSENGGIVASDSGNVVVAPGALQPNPIQNPNS